MTAPLAERIPDRVVVYEVGPRDGLQNEPARIPAEVKVELIRRLTEAGLSAVETTSFVRPEWVPQLADAEQVVRALPDRPGVRYPVLVPNRTGLRRAIEAGVREIAIFGSATETFAQRNLNRSVADSLASFEPVVQEARAAGLWVRGYLSMVFGDPWEGDVPVEQAVDVAERLWQLGVDELSLGDTIGVARPLQVQRVLVALARELPLEAVAVHFHDTYGQGLANVLAALEVGVRTIDASVGGLGGCPFAKSATGNLATEELVYMIDGLGVQTGIDLQALVETARWISERLGREPTSRLARALAPASTAART